MLSEFFGASSGPMKPQLARCGETTVRTDRKTHGSSDHTIQHLQTARELVRFLRIFVDDGARQECTLKQRRSEVIDAQLHTRIGAWLIFSVLGIATALIQHAQPGSIV